jgi:hypothetical protein
MTDNVRISDTQHDEVDLALQLLASGVPLTLLLDLATPVHSAELYSMEAGAADWLYAGVA